MSFASAALASYRYASFVGIPFIRYFLVRRRRFGREDSVRFAERFGYPGMSRPDGEVVWIHGASVGEAISALPLIRRLGCETKANFLLTTGTLTSARIVANQLPDRTVHQYVPVDVFTAVERFVRHWKPDLVLWLESELWPNMLSVLQNHKVPHVMINARMSSRSFDRWRFLKPVARHLLSGFEMCLAQSPKDAERFRFLGAKNVFEVGNLKHAAPALSVVASELTVMRQTIVGRPVWLAASTHAGEEQLAADVHGVLSKSIPDLLTIVAPRHANRGSAVAKEIALKGLTIRRRSLGELPTSDTQIYIADTMGEMGLWYTISPLVWLGKSLIGNGGQNPIEPCLFGCAIVCGDSMDNFSDIVDKLSTIDAIIQVDSWKKLADSLKALLTAPGRAEAMGLRAKLFAEGENSAIEKILDTLMPVLSSCNMRFKPKLE